MNHPAPDDQRASAPRPAAAVLPTHERAVRALAALQEKRIADADSHAAAIPETPLIHRAWRLLLQGLLAIERKELARAEPLFLQAAALGFVQHVGPLAPQGAKSEAQSEKIAGVPHPFQGWGTDSAPAPPDDQAVRLAARALQHLGWIYRRQDRAHDARVTHLASYRLRERFGSFEELWDTAIELGLDADVLRQYDEARRWYEAALEFATRTPDDSQRRRAVAFDHLATSSAEAGRFDEAVSATRTAREAWQQHDVGGVEAALADMKLGAVLLRQGESLHEEDSPGAKRALGEAVQWLAAAHEALLAFGPDYTAQAAQCSEQKDFAERLLASLEA